MSFKILICVILFTPFILSMTTIESKPWISEHGMYLIDNLTDAGNNEKCPWDSIYIPEKDVTNASTIDYCRCLSQCPPFKCNHADFDPQLPVMGADTGPKFPGNCCQPLVCHPRRAKPLNSYNLITQTPTPPTGTQVCHDFSGRPHDLNETSQYECDICKCDPVSLVYSCTTPQCKSCGYQKYIHEDNDCCNTCLSEEYITSVTFEKIHCPEGREVFPEEKCPLEHKCVKGRVPDKDGCIMCQCSSWNWRSAITIDPAESGDVEVIPNPIKCKLDRFVTKEDGELWYDAMHRYCSCVAGKVMCSIVQCPNLNCSSPSYNGLITACPSCLPYQELYDLHTYNYAAHKSNSLNTGRNILCSNTTGHNLTESTVAGTTIFDKRVQCLCHEGQAICSAKQCPPLMCINTTPPAKGSYCPTCSTELTFEESKNLKAMDYQSNDTFEIKVFHIRDRRCLAFDNNVSWRLDSCSSCMCLGINSTKELYYLETAPRISIHSPEFQGEYTNENKFFRTYYPPAVCIHEECDAKQLENCTTTLIVEGICCPVCLDKLPQSQREKEFRVDEKQHLSVAFDEKLNGTNIRDIVFAERSAEKGIVQDDNDFSNNGGEKNNSKIGIYVCIVLIALFCITLGIMYIRYRLANRRRCLIPPPPNARLSNIIQYSYVPEKEVPVYTTTGNQDERQHSKL